MSTEEKKAAADSKSSGTAPSKSTSSRRTKKNKREDIVLTKENILYQPLALAVNGYEATAFQQNVVIAVLRKLRGAIKDQRDGQFKKKPVQLSIFDNEGVKNNFLKDGDLAFDIHLKELGVDTPHYNQAFKAVCTIADAKVWVPAEKDGKPIMIRKSFFEIGSENMEIVVDPHTGRQTYKYKNRSPIFTVIMSKEVVNVLFPQDGRIYDFVDNTAMMIGEKFPKRIYLYLSNFKYMEDGLTVDYWKFRHDIGFNDNEVDPKTKERIIQYPHYCDFVKRVLRPSVETLKDMADNNVSDFYFEYTPIYKTNKRQKNPDQLHFEFHLSNVGQSIREDKAAARETIVIERRLTEEFDQSNAQIRKIVMSLTPDDRQAFIEKMDELKEAIDSKKVQIKDSKRSYCNRTFTDFIQTRIEDKKRMAEKMQMDSIQEQSSMAKESDKGVGEKGKDSVVSQLYSPDDLKQFNKVKEELVAEHKDIGSWLSEITLWKVESDTVTVAVPTPAFHETFQYFFPRVLDDKLEQIFGRQVGVYFIQKMS